MLKRDLKVGSTVVVAGGGVGGLVFMAAAAEVPSVEEAESPERERLRFNIGTLLM